MTARLDFGLIARFLPPTLLTCPAFPALPRAQNDFLISLGLERNTIMVEKVKKLISKLFLKMFSAVGVILAVILFADGYLLSAH